MKKPLRIVTNSSRFVYGSRIVVWRERQTPLWLVVWARDLQSCINFIVKVWTGKGVMSYHVIFVQPINPNRGSKCLFEMTQSLDDHRTVCSCASICCRSVFVSISRYCKNSWTTNLCQTMLPQMCMMNSNEFKIDDIWIEWIEFDFHQHSTGLWYSYRLVAFWMWPATLGTWGIRLPLCLALLLAIQSVFASRMPRPRKTSRKLGKTLHWRRHISEVLVVACCMYLTGRCALGINYDNVKTYDIVGIDHTSALVE